MNKAWICIGSNSNREANLTLCRTLLSQHFDTITYTQTITSSAYGDSYHCDFTNQLAILNCKEDIKAIESLLKTLEKKLGRKDDDKAKGIVKIDIDLLQWNNTILRPEELTRPYIQTLLETLTKEERE